MNIEEYSFKYNFIKGTELKLPLIIGLDFAKGYKLGVDWDTSEKLYLWHDGSKIAIMKKKGNSERQVMTIYEMKLTDKQERNEKIHVVTKHTIIIPPYHISIVPLPSINHTENIKTNTLLEIENSLFFCIKQLNITITPTLQKLESRMPDKFMAYLWNPGGKTITIKIAWPLAMSENPFSSSKNPKLTNEKVLGKFAKYLRTHYHLYLKSLHSQFTIPSS